MGFAVYHMEKGKGGSGGIGRHIDRLESKYGYSTYKHADPSLREQNREFILNEHGDKPLSKAIEDRIKEGYTQTKEIRKDAVKFQTHVLTGSHEEMKAIFSDEETANHWIKANIDWMCRKYGKENIVRFTLHMDEKTPHIHVITVPITPDGRLSAKSYADGKKALRELQTDYAQHMEKFGLQRGLERVGVKHESAQEYYARNKRIDDYLQEPTIKPIEPKKGLLSNNFEEIYQQNQELSLLVASFTDTLKKQERKIEELSQTSQKTIATNRHLILNKDAIIQQELVTLTTDYRTLISEKDTILNEQKHILNDPVLLVQRAKQLEERKLQQYVSIKHKLEIAILQAICLKVQAGETRIDNLVIDDLIREMVPLKELGVRNPWMALDLISHHERDQFEEQLYKKVDVLLQVLELGIKSVKLDRSEFHFGESLQELSSRNQELILSLETNILQAVIIQLQKGGTAIDQIFIDDCIRKFSPTKELGVSNPWEALDRITEDNRGQFESNLYEKIKVVEQLFDFGIALPKLALLDEEEELTQKKPTKRFRGRGLNS